MQKPFAGNSAGSLLTLCILLLVANLTVFAGLLNFHLQTLEPVQLAECLQFGSQAQPCAEWRLHAHLAEPHWLARLFTVHALVSLMLTLLLCLPRHRRATATALTSGGAAALLLLLVLDPGRLSATATLFGALVGGLIASRMSTARKPA